MIFMNEPRTSFGGIKLAHPLGREVRGCTHEQEASCSITGGLVLKVIHALIHTQVHLHTQVSAETDRAE